jgi:hypothetical protein
MLHQWSRGCGVRRIAEASARLLRTPVGGSGAGVAVGTHWNSVDIGRGLHSLNFRAQLEDLRDTSLTLELNLSTFGPHSRVTLGYMADKVTSVERTGTK